MLTGINLVLLVMGLVVVYFAIKVLPSRGA
jgi:hypothetical protein